jgi:hypothetical protein
MTVEVTELSIEWDRYSVFCFARPELTRVLYVFYIFYGPRLPRRQNSMKSCRAISRVRCLYETDVLRSISCKKGQAELGM